MVLQKKCCRLSVWRMSVWPNAYSGLYIRAHYPYQLNTYSTSEINIIYLLCYFTDCNDILVCNGEQYRCKYASPVCVDFNWLYQTELC